MHTSISDGFVAANDGSEYSYSTMYVPSTDIDIDLSMWYA